MQTFKEKNELSPLLVHDVNIQYIRSFVLIELDLEPKKSKRDPMRAYKPTHELFME